jgi:hypothetical protein
MPLHGRNDAPRQKRKNARRPCPVVVTAAFVGGGQIFVLTKPNPKLPSTWMLSLNFQKKIISKHVTFQIP